MHSLTRFDAAANQIRVVGLLLLAILVGCGDGDTDSGDARRPQASADAEGSNGSVTNGPDTVVDAYKRRRIFSQAPARVISFAPNLTETVFFVGAGDRLVARTDFCNYPPEANALESIGTLFSYNYERLVALRPDLLLMMTFDGSSRKEYDRLEALGLQPFALSEGPLDGIIDGIDTVGRLFGRTEETRRKTDVMRRRLDSLRRFARSEEPVSVFVVIESSPLITVSSGFIDQMITAAGGRNIAAGDATAYPRYSREVVLRDDPDVILISGFSNDAVDKLLRLYPEWNGLRAARNGKIVVFDSDLLSRPGPRLIEGIVALREVLKGM